MLHEDVLNESVVRGIEVSVEHPEDNEVSMILGESQRGMFLIYVGNGGICGFVIGFNT